MGHASESVSKYVITAKFNFQNDRNEKYAEKEEVWRSKLFERVTFELLFYLQVIFFKRALQIKLEEYIFKHLTLEIF